MKLEFGKPESKVEFASQAKHNSSVALALKAMRQLGIGVVKQCDICHEWPYETCFDSWLCNHRGLFDKSLRDAGYDLAVLNDAARQWAKENSSE